LTDGTVEVFTINPATNAAQWMKRADLAGDHVFPKSAFAMIKGQAGTLTPGQIRQLDALRDGTHNLRAMPSNVNSSKWNRTAEQWAQTGIGANRNLVHRDYLESMATIQKSIARSIEEIIGGSVPETQRFLNQSLDGIQ
jgi:hypothetical protein